MPSKEFTYLFCLDEKKSYFSEVNRRFNDADRYEVLTSHGRHEFLNMIRQYRQNRGFKVAILPFANTSDQYQPVKTIAAGIKTLIPDVVIILLVSGDAPEELVAKSGIEPYSWVPATNNSVLRIHNSVKKYISEENLSHKIKRKRKAFRVFVASVVLALLFLLFSMLRYPSFF